MQYHLDRACERNTVFEDNFIICILPYIIMLPQILLKSTSQFLKYRMTL